MDHKTILSHALSGIRQGCYSMAAAERNGIHISMADIAVKQNNQKESLFRVVVIPLSDATVKTTDDV